jgi:hypothetical protein
VLHHLPLDEARRPLEEDLGLFRTSVSGPMTTTRDRRMNELQFWRLVGERLALEIERRARDGLLRDEWEEPVADVAINLVEVFAGCVSPSRG